jgi:NTP pyrophosphatase (non-canonical NTP hydrolase)
MTLEEHFQQYERFVEKNAFPSQRNTSIRAFCLMLEAAEVGNEIKRIETKDDGHLTYERRDQIQDEMGDLFYYFVLLMAEFNFDLVSIMRHNRMKLEARHGQYSDSAEYLGFRLEDLGRRSVEAEYSYSPVPDVPQAH